MPAQRVRNCNRCGHVTSKGHRCANVVPVAGQWCGRCHPPTVAGGPAPRGTGTRGLEHQARGLAEADLGTPVLGGSGWAEGTYPSGVNYFRREVGMPDGTVLSQSVSFSPGKPWRGSEEVGSGGIVLQLDGALPGELHYLLLRSPVAGTTETVDAIFVNWVEVKKKGRGWASAMYRALREAHPGWVVPAADVLEGPGRRLVKHYRERHPEAHFGRFDTNGVVHLTSGPEDPLYRPSILNG